MKSFEFNPRKFREAMVFFAENGNDDFWFGSTRLAKQLFFLDFYSYANFGEPVTGATYMHQPRGPVPRQLLVERNKLVTSGRLAVEDNVLSPGRVQKRPVACDNPDMSVFDEFEVNLLQGVAGMFRNATASNVSEWTHRFAGWKLTRNGDDIPYFTALVGDVNHLTLDDVAWGREVATTHAASR